MTSNFFGSRMRHRQRLGWLRTFWRRIDDAYITQFAVVFALTATDNIIDPLAPHDAWALSALAVLIVGVVLKVVARLADDERRREWPLHTEAAGNALCAAAFLLVATRAAMFAENWQELAGIYLEYGLIALIFYNRLRTVRRALKELKKSRRGR